jgi:hypothetical protein
MSRLPRISGRECIAALGKAGFYVKRQEGSHDGSLCCFGMSPLNFFFCNG